MALLFANIHPIPTSCDELVNIVFSKTNRKTATVMHGSAQLTRIREFYMNKVNFAKDQFQTRLSQILDDFPRLDSIHPFWASLINVIYDRDHYKLALGQILSVRTTISNIGRDYVKFIKYGDSQYRCKTLKRAALGRMRSACRRLTPALQYLEEVRQHLQRLPGIDPSRPTIILSGAPSTGKSSFMNTITRANVEVAAFPFTTKSLYMGHTDFNYQKWQVLDTPGLLDRPLEERNTIEMQAVMAMVHLRSAIVYMLDVSGTSGYSIESQVQLYNSLREIFDNRPVTIVLTKTDLVNPDELPQEEKDMIDSLVGPNVQLMRMSALTGDGVELVKNSVCNRLLKMRVEAKMNSDKMAAVQSQLFVARPDSSLEPNIPASVFNPQGLGRPTLRELEEEAGGPGQFYVDTNAEKQLANPEWSYHQIPEIMEGKNIMDYYSENIGDVVNSLAEEERVRYQQYLEEKRAFEETAWKTTPEQDEINRIILEKRKILRSQAELKRNSTVPISRTLQKRSKEQVVERISKALEERGADEETKSRAVEKIMSMKPTRVKKEIVPVSHSKGVRRKGEGERFDYYIKTNYVLEPKHLYSGKMGFKRDFK